MSRTPYASIVIALRCCAIVLALAALAPPADAGLGDLMKKAKDKAAQAVGQKPADAASTAYVAPVFDDVTVELNSQRIERILAAFKAAGAAGAGRPALVEKLSKVSEERHVLEDKHGDAMREQRGKREDVAACYQDGYQQAQSRRMEEYAKRALTDPALREKFAKAAQQHNAAAGEGDSASIKRLQDIAHAEMSATPEDSASVRKACGPVPPRLAAEDKADALDKEIASTNEQIRKIDENVAKAQASAGGMSQQQLAMAIERIQMYMADRRSSRSSKSGKGSRSGSGSGSGSGGSDGSGSGSDSNDDSKSDAPVVSGYTKVEVIALERYLEQLKAVLG